MEPGGLTRNRPERCWFMLSSSEHQVITHLHKVTKFSTAVWTHSLQSGRNNSTTHQNTQSIRKTPAQCRNTQMSQAELSVWSSLYTFLLSFVWVHQGGSKHWKSIKTHLRLWFLNIKAVMCKIVLQTNLHFGEQRSNSMTLSCPYLII